MEVDFSRRYQNQYYYVFLISVLLCWSPLKALVNILPFIIVGMLVFIFRDNRFGTLNTPLLNRLIIYISAVLFVFLLYAIIYPNDFVLTNAIFSLITYSATLVIFCIPSKGLESKLLLKRIGKTLVVLFVIESIYGIMQSFYGVYKAGVFERTNGDLVEGTIHPALVSELSFSNPLYTVNMISGAIMIFFLARYFSNSKWIWVILIFSLAIILASVLHLLLFGVFSVIAYKLYFSNLGAFLKPKRLFVGSVLLGVFVFALIKLLGQNLTEFQGYYEAFKLYRPAKLVVLENFFVVVRSANIEQFVAGFGPGQYASKANLMLNSSYYSDNFFIESVARNEASIYFLTIVEGLPKVGQSAVVKPFFSMFSVLTEFGILGFSILLFLFLKFIASVNSLKYKDVHLAGLIICLAYFLFFLGFLEYYWETPQAILIPILVIKPVYALLKYE
jgi:hypothetical protein